MYRPTAAAGRSAGRAAEHYVALVQTPATNRAFFNALPLEESERREIVRSGVDAFLRVYGPR
ncbi:TetR/AcrR family transcriptional regulator C-terminal domain-containing protein [Nocardiopsis flavescens]|uniref:TetR/AcrR family transcriptional regulator C-terminal domain-containing protein n=1 Tax=Nocardiopsis flavescens TaxID=758803 RepID=UPI00365B209B